MTAAKAIMLKPLTDCSLSVPESISLCGRGWCAIDFDSGATLEASDGRSQTGRARRYILIVPDNPPASRDEVFGWQGWSESGRKRFRAWTEEEAVEKGNRKLAEILAKRI